jgi:hypothetical protein
MKFEIPKCPECGEYADGIIEIVEGRATLERSSDNDVDSFDYAGDTDMWWDEQKPVPQTAGRVSVMCPKDHEWLTKVTDRDRPQEDPNDGKYRDAAKKLHHREGELEIDDDAIVSKGDDPGAYVQAWIWVPNSDAGVEEEAEEENEDDEDV